MTYNGEPKYYSESQKTTVPGKIIAYSTIVFVTLFSGYFYAIAVSIIPIVYFNFITTIAFILLLWATNRILVRFTHNRSRRDQIIQAIVGGLLANYFQWTCYILYMREGGIPSFSSYLLNISWIFSPSHFFETIGLIYQFGAWSIFGIHFSGFPLALIWLLEALAIGAAPALMVARANVYPYSENTNKWYPKYSLIPDYETVSAAGFVPQLQQDPLEAIVKLGRGSALRHAKIHIYYTPDEQEQFLAVEIMTAEGQGRAYKSGSIVIDNYCISRHQAESILAAVKHEQRRLDIL